MPTSSYCSCGNLRAKSQGRCAECTRAYQKQRRLERRGLPKTESQRAKDNVRSQTRTSLLAHACVVCGEKAQVHHNDYSNPLDIEWLCRNHHYSHHRNLRQSYSPADSIRWMKELYETQQWVESSVEGVCCE